MLCAVLALLAHSFSDPVVVSGSAKTTATILWMHGLGDTGSSWRDFAEHVTGQLPHVKVVLLTAPQRPITLNGGRETTGWYDITSLEVHQRCFSSPPPTLLCRILIKERTHAESMLRLSIWSV